MIKAGLTKGTWDLRLYDVPLPLGKGEAGFVKHERTKHERTTL
jgi:hypothetical protein